ncbi:MAG: DUF6458 family protein [Stackebrandtia sp.]
MGLGGSIFFLVLGAILAFAVRAEPTWIDLYTTGWIFMIAGAVGMAVTSWYVRHKKRVHKEVHDTYQASRMARREAIKRSDAAARPKNTAQGDATKSGPTIE